MADQDAPSPWRRLLRYAWQAPLFAVPFALFFGTIQGATVQRYLQAYPLSLTFTVVIFLCIWAMECLVLPRLQAALPSWQPTGLDYGLVFGLTGVAGSLLAAWMVHLFVLPGFLGSARRVAAFGMYALLFAGLITALSLALHYHRSAVEHARREKELELARRIQHSFLPESFPPSARVEVHALNVPSRGVSGDFYDVVAGDGALLLAVADVEGKSMPAALLSAMLQASLRTQTSWLDSTSAILANVNALVCRRSNTVQQFATFFLARVTEAGQLSYTNAGHNPPLLLRAAGEMKRLDRGGVMLGVMEGLPYEEETVALSPGDRLLIYTDGITERTDGRGEEFGPGRLETLLRTLPPELPCQEVNARILRELDLFSGRGEADDDQTLLALRVR